MCRRNDATCAARPSARSGSGRARSPRPRAPVGGRRQRLDLGEGGLERRRRAAVPRWGAARRPRPGRRTSSRPRPPTARRAGRSRSARSGGRRPRRGRVDRRGHVHRLVRSVAGDVEVAVVVDDGVRQRVRCGWAVVGCCAQLDPLEDRLGEGFRRLGRDPVGDAVEDDELVGRVDVLLGELGAPSPARRRWSLQTNVVGAVTRDRRTPRVDHQDRAVPHRARGAARRRRRSRPEAGDLVGGHAALEQLGGRTRRRRRRTISSGRNGSWKSGDVVRLQELVGGHGRPQEGHRVRHRHRGQGAQRSGCCVAIVQRRPRPSHARRRCAAADPVDERGDVVGEVPASGSRSAASGGRPASSRAGPSRSSGSRAACSSGTTYRHDVRALREAVQQDDRLAVERALVEHVERQPVALDGGDPLSVSSTCTAWYTSRFGTPAILATSTIASLRLCPSSSWAATAAQTRGVHELGPQASPQPPRWSPRRAPRRPPTMRAPPAARGVPPRGSWSARGTPPPPGRRPTPPPSPRAPPRCGAAPRRTPSSAARRRAPPVAGPARRPCAAGSPRSRTGPPAAPTRPAR